MKFKPGDRVQLKAGGPVITIEQVNLDGRLFCSWLDKKSARLEGTFAPSSLKHYREEDPLRQIEPLTEL